jgi:uncharacterized protein YfdQ (DUF2303 family)
MSIDKQTIEKLQQNHTLERIQLEVRGILSEQINGAPVTAVPEGFQITNLEKYMPEKFRFTGQFDTSNIENFAQYMKHYDSANGAVFVDSNDMLANCIFDLGTENKPLHAGHTAKLKLAITAEYKRLKQIDGNPIVQRAFAEWLEDLSANIKFTDAEGKDMNPVAVVGAVRKVDIEALSKRGSTEESFKSERTALESISVSDAEKLPAFVLFECIPYHGLETHVIKCRVSAITGDSAVKFSLKIINSEQLTDQLADEFVAVLKKSINALELSPPIFIGSFAA